MSVPPSDISDSNRAGARIALDTCEEKEYNPPRKALALYQKGKSFSSLGEYKQAKDAFRQAVCLAPNFTEAYYELGLTLLKLLRLSCGTPEFYDLAIEIQALDRHINLRASLLKVHSTLGDLLNLLEHYKQEFIACNNATAFMNVVSPAYNSSTANTPIVRAALIEGMSNLAAICRQRFTASNNAAAFANTVSPVHNSSTLNRTPMTLPSLQTTFRSPMHSPTGRTPMTLPSLQTTFRSPIHSPTVGSSSSSSVGSPVYYNGSGANTPASVAQAISQPYANFPWIRSSIVPPTYNSSITRRSEALTTQTHSQNFIGAHSSSSSSAESSSSSSSTTAARAPLLFLARAALQNTGGEGSSRQKKRKNSNSTGN